MCACIQYIYIHRNIHVYFYICMSISICVLKTRVCDDTSNSNLLPQGLFCVCSSFSNNVKPGSYYPQYVYLVICSIPLHAFNLPTLWTVFLGLANQVPGLMPIPPAPVPLTLPPAPAAVLAGSQASTTGRRGGRGGCGCDQGEEAGGQKGLDMYFY